MIEVFRNDYGVLVRWDGAAGFVAVLDTGDADGRLIESFQAAGPVTREQAEAEASRWWTRQLAHSEEDDDRVAAYDLAYQAVEEYLRGNKGEYLRLLDVIMDNHAYTCWAVIALMGTTANVVREIAGLDADGWARMADYLRTHDPFWSSVDVAGQQAAVEEPE